MKRYRTRMGDGSFVELSESELKAELEQGTNDAADRGKIPPLPPEELQYLFNLYSFPSKFMSVEMGKEVVLSYDAATLKLRRVGVSTHRIQSLHI